MILIVHFHVWPENRPFGFKGLNTKLSQLTFRKLKEGVVQWGGRAENEGQLVELVGKPKF